MKRPRLSLSKNVFSDLVCSVIVACSFWIWILDFGFGLWSIQNPKSKIDSGSFSRVPARDRFLHHLFIDGHYARGRLELEGADHPAENLAQCSCTEPLLARGVPGDVDQRCPCDLQIDTEALEVIARGSEDRSLRHHEYPGEIGFREIVQHHDRLETRYELRGHPATEEIFVLEVVAQVERE